MTAIALLHPSLSPKVVKPFQRITPDLVIQHDLRNAEVFHAALIFGGDGTVHRYLPELHKYKIPALIVPAGSGNDFAKALGIANPRVAVQAWKRFCSTGDNVKEIDLGVIHAEDQETLFCCVAGMGLDAEANRLANRMSAWLRSYGGYVVAAVQSLAGFKRVEFTLRTQDRTITREGFLAAVANAHRYGGGMKIAPQAKLDDGQLDVCFIGWMAKLKVLCALPTLPFGGHLRLKEVEYFSCPAIRIEASSQLDVYADGDYVCQTPVEISLLPRALRVIMPE
ncbi:MAG TPA: diacylglycerol kinase family protein [Terriglobales bacterium]|nr:diacylglycerol kinase family protein [Terriglobales bacterium]